MHLGTHFALDDAQAEALLGAGTEAELRRLVESFRASAAACCDDGTAWDPISCALAPASEVDRDPDEWPAYGVILGDDDLAAFSDELLVGYLEPSHVAEVSAWLGNLDEDFFAAAYAAMPEDLRNAEYGDDERADAWEHLETLRGFFRAAAEAGHHVVFHVAAEPVAGSQERAESRA